jgi:hypothetical protein
MDTKERFLKEGYIPLLKKLRGDEKGNFGKLSPQGMVEHMSDSFGVAYGRIQQPLHTPEHMVQRFREFALSDKPFKPDTKNAYMNEQPDPLRKGSMNEAIAELEGEIKVFLDFYKNDPGKKILNPFFGEFNYEEWLHLLHKHAMHHLKQFNLL